MNKFIITIDSSCDCDIKELQKNNIPVVFFNYADETMTYKDTMDETRYKNFYQQMRNGSVFKTSQINPTEFYDFFKLLLKENLPIIHISLGSGLSNTINSVFIAINQLKEEYPNCDIKPVDSKFASLGLTILLNDLIKYRNEGMDAETAYNKVLDIVDNINAYFTTDTLTYFARGGRLSKVSAFIGNAIKINPVLDVDPLGKLRIVEKVRGSNHALEKLINRCTSQVINAGEQEVLVCHADNLEKANLVGNRLVEEVGFKSYKTYFMGPIIGAHTGPGLIAVFFKGKKRDFNTSNLSYKEKEKLQNEMNKNIK
jgi:DegV family protein with EDD domain